jgi:hypothetical protein
MFANLFHLHFCWENDKISTLSSHHIINKMLL